MKDHCIVFDTNVFERNPHIHRGQWRVFRSVARKLGFRILVPEVVLGELCSHSKANAQVLIAQRKEQIQDLVDLVNDYWSGMHLIGFEDVHEDSAKRLKSMQLAVPDPATAKTRIRKRLDYTVGRSIEILSAPTANFEQILNRSFDNKKPFSPGGKGFKDYLIWLNIIDALKDNPSHNLVFISGNTNDFGKEALHSELLEDLTPDERTRLKYFNELAEFNRDFAAVSLPEDFNLAQTLLSTRRSQFISALDDFFCGEYSARHPIHATEVCDEMDGETSFTYTELIPIEINHANPIGEDEYFLTGKFIWAIDAFPSYNESVVPGSHIRRGYQLDVESVYNKESGKVLDFAISSQKIVPAFRLDFRFEQNSTCTDWTICASSKKKQKHWTTRLPDYQSVLNCARDFNIHPRQVANFIESGMTNSHVVCEVATFEALDFWKFAIV